MNNGSNSIMVYYCGTSWDAAIDKEIKRLGLKRGQVAVIAMPETMKKKQKREKENIAIVIRQLD